MADTNLHIFFSPSGRHVEFNSHARRKIDGLIVLLRGFELNLLRRANRGFVQTMAQTADDAIHVHSAIGKENQIQNNVAF